MVSFLLSWIIHAVRCLEFQGRNGFALLEYAEPMLTQEMRADRYPYGEQFGKFIVSEFSQYAIRKKGLHHKINIAKSIRYFFFAELLINYSGYKTVTISHSPRGTVS